MGVQVIGEDYVKDLSKLQKLNDFVTDANLIRDISKVKQVGKEKHRKPQKKHLNFLRGRIRWYFQCRKTAKHFYNGEKKESAFAPGHIR